MPHMKAKDVPFHIWYGGLICIKAFQSDIPKWGGLFADPRWTSVCKTVSKTLLEWDENRRCLSLSACHLAVSLSRICYHASYERGHSGLPADTKIRTIVQLIGILWSYFGVQLGSTSEALHFGLSLCNPLKDIRLPYTRWKGTYIAFIWCIVAQYISRGCRVRGQNVELHSKTPGGRQNMIIKYLSVGQGSWFSNQQVALNVLFHMRYDSMPYSKKQPSDRPKCWASLVDLSGTPKYDHKIPISWTIVLIFISAGSLGCPLSDEVW